MADERDIHVEDPTPIIPDWAYIADQCVSLEASLRGAASDVGACGRVVKSGRGGVQALEELRQCLVDRAEQCAGAVRGIDRYLQVRQQDSNEGVRLTEEPTPQTLRSLPPVPQPLALLPAQRPSLLKRVARSYVTHAIIGITSIGLLGHSVWVTVKSGKPIDGEAIGAFVLAFVQRGTAIASAGATLAGAIWGLRAAMKGSGGPPEDPPPPVTTPR